MTKATGPSGPPDGGLQLERSDLAWRRTALGLTAALMLASRLSASAHPWLGFALPLAALAAGGILMAAAARRSGRWLRAWRAGGPVPRAPGARLLLVATALAALAAAVGACLVLGVYGPVGP
ncbi:DUF202 domain-containing protein [Glycomyces arizonensis]|uniref:DUF202 domain-containing protein n=1 Tax=Glycomyces arizonensis TaxID=256035 RepID=UPI0004032B28|nr:DUF202 domain-containing protein [Glycomyces arizonensis]